MFTLDKPVTASGGGFNLPPVTPSKPFAPAGGAGNGANKPAPKATPTPIAIPRPAYPKPRAWVEKRIALCERAHIRWLAFLSDGCAALKDWRESQPGFCPAKYAAEIRMAEIRRAQSNR